jgi:hypothetical protein
VVAYFQSVKMTALAKRAFDEGADWVFPFDADEVFYSLSGGTVRDALEGCSASVIEAYGYDHIPQRSDVAEDGNPFSRMGWRRELTQKFPKVVFRSDAGALIHQGNHNVDRSGERVPDVLGYRHFQYRSFEQMARKVRNGRAAYEASQMHRGQGAHWRRLGALSDEALDCEWSKLLNEEGLIFDPAPVRVG